MRAGCWINGRALCATAAAAMTACSAGPLVIQPDGTKIVLTASMLERSGSESAAVKLANGTEIIYDKHAKEQTVIAKEGIKAWTAAAGINATKDALNAAESIWK